MITENYEEFLIPLSLLYNESLETIKHVHNEVFNFTVLRLSDIHLFTQVNIPKKKRTIDKLNEINCVDWTQFTKQLLYALKDQFSEFMEERILIEDR